MINIFETFLPQLLRYPNPTDPLNGEAAALLMREPAAYESRVKGRARVCKSVHRTLCPFCLTPDHVSKYATKDAIEATGDESESDDDMSSIDSFSDEEAPGMEM